MPPEKTEKYRKKTRVFGAGEEAEYVYQVISGAVRSCKLLSDSRRLINAFHLPGDIFGLQNGSIHRFTAEAIVDTEVRMTRQLSLVDTLANWTRQAGATSLDLVTRNLHHAQNHMLLLGRKTAQEKVAAFLHEMDVRLDHPNVMDIPMPRRDIADYLGLKVETVSRSLATLRDAKVVRFDGSTHRRIVLLDRRRLLALEDNL